MHCPQCGVDAIEDARFCLKCGTQLREGVDTLSRFDMLEREPCGVGGGLLFFGIWLTTLSPLATCYDLMMTCIVFGPDLSNGDVKAAMVTVTVGLVALAIYGCVVGIKIRRGNRRGKQLAIQYLVGRVVGVSVTIWVGFAILPSEDFSQAQTSGELCILMMSNPTIVFATSLIWILYLLMSRRVRNTYGNDSLSISIRARKGRRQSKRSAWCAHLRTGMSPEKVRDALGEPSDIDVGNFDNLQFYEKWCYPEGAVTFQEGVVSSWSAPGE